MSQRFFFVALVVVLGTVVAYGGWTGQYVADSIVRGVGETAARSINALVSRSLEGVLLRGSLSEQDRREIDAAFDVASSTDRTRLLLLRLRQLDGTLVLQTGNDLRDDASKASQAAAAEGKVSVMLIDVVVPGIGGLPASPLPVMKIYTPLSASDGRILGIAELFFGARAIAERVAEARMTAWMIAALVGFLALGLVALIVDVTGRVIETQRLRLARNLARTRALLKGNIALQQVSDRLRMESILANERVLSEVGSDIHDGPVQLLTLLILRMPATSEAARTDLALAEQAMEELRAISSGLVLPEMTSMSLGQVIEAAVERHQNLTGRGVDSSLDIPAGTESPLTTRICAYRVTQEALTNAFRHGGGATPRISARLEKGWLEIRVTNTLPEGASIEPSPGRLGLRGMQFRVESQGGRMRLFTSGGEAILDACIPLDERPQPLSPASLSSS
ncbi:MAG: sensor histidine kinase [Devosia sp.]